jgi:hypothetical protein
MWWAHEKSKLADGGKIRGLVMVSGFTNSQKLSWMNALSWCWNQNLIQLLNSLEQQPMNGHNNSGTVYYGTGHAETKEHLQGSLR